MPIAPGTINDIWALASKDLRHFGEQNHVPLELRARLVRLGFKSANAFALVEDSAPEVRKFIKEDVGLRIEGNPEYRSAVASIIAAWESANKRGEKRRGADAEQQAGDQPRKLPKKEHQQLIRAYNDINVGHELKPIDTPAECWVEASIDQLGDGELEAERLTEAANKLEAKKDVFLATPRSCQTAPSKSSDRRRLPCHCQRTLRSYVSGTS